MDLEATLYKTAKVSSIKKQLRDITFWLQGRKKTKSKIMDINESRQSYTSELQETLIQEEMPTNESLPYQRYIVFSICVSDDLMIEDINGLNIKPVQALFEALLESMDNLRPEDYVCFNIANSSLKLFNDCQARMESWETVDEKFVFLKEVFGVYKRMKTLD